MMITSSSSTAGSIGMEASPFWCFMCSRLHRPDGLATCPRRAPRTALEEIVEVMDAGEFLQACARRHAPGAATAAGSMTRQQLPAITVRDAGRTCAVCLDDLEPGGSAVATPCDHAYHPQCITPWLEANDTCPLCRGKSGLQVVQVQVQVQDDGMVSAPDGLVLCDLLYDGRYRLGRRVAGRIFAVRIVDRDGKLVRGGVLGRLGAACHRVTAAAGNFLLLCYRDCVIPNFDLLAIS